MALRETSRALFGAMALLAGIATGCRPAAIETAHLDLGDLSWYAAQQIVADKNQCPLEAGGGWRRVAAPPLNLAREFQVEAGSGLHRFSLCARAVIPAELLDSAESPRLFLPGIGDSWRLFINGRLLRDELLLAADGQRVDRHRTQMGAVINVDRSLLQPGENVIFFEFAGEAHSFAWAVGGTPGFFYDAGYLLGPPAAIDRLRAQDVWLGGAFVYLVFGLYHLLLFLGRRSERYLLYFGVAGASIFVYLLSRSYYAYTIAPDSSWLSRFEIFSLHLIGPALAGFLHHYLYARLNRAAKIYMALFAGLALAAFVAPVRALPAVTQVFLYLQLPWVALYFPYFLFRAIADRRADAARVSVAIGVFLLTAIWDILNGIYSFTSTDPLFQYGFFALMAYLTALQVWRFHRVHHEMDRLNRELDQKNSALLAIDRLKDEFLANTSHELRTPLHGITGIADSLIDGAAGPLPSRVADNLNLIATSARRLGNLIDDILDMSRLRDGRLNVELHAVDLSAAVQTTVDLLVPLARDRGLFLETRLPADLPHVLADESRLLQILSNLIGNAIKFTEQGGVTVTAEVISDRVRVAVIDTGPGIPAAAREQVFEPFYQVHGGDTRSYRGAGLGLTIVRQLLELHGSAIELESAEGGGTCFRFELKAAQGLPSTMRGPKRATTPAPSNRTPIAVEQNNGVAEILVADDEPVNLQVLSNMLNAAGYRVRTVGDGQSALEGLLGDDPPDAAILDVMMPGLSGYDVLRRVRERRSPVELPVLIVTARGGEGEAPAAFEAGANDYLSKPFQSRELLARLGASLSLKHAAEERGRLRAMTEDLRIARKIQNSILPASAPGVRGLEIALLYRPMSAVGGDFYDFHLLDDRRLGVISADIAGHGASAAMIAAMLKVAFASEEASAEEPARLLSRLNRSMFGKCENGFITAGYCFFDLGRRSLRFSRAGHTPLAVLRSGERHATAVGGGGPALGWRPRIDCEIIELPLSTGDRYFLYTDGLSDARNRHGESFSEERLFDLFGYAGALPLRDSVHFIEDALNRWTEGRNFEDDLSLVCVQID